MIQSWRDLLLLLLTIYIPISNLIFNARSFRHMGRPHPVMNTFECIFPLLLIFSLIYGHRVHGPLRYLVNRINNGPLNAIMIIACLIGYISNCATIAHFIGGFTLTQIIFKWVLPFVSYARVRRFEPVGVKAEKTRCHQQSRTTTGEQSSSGGDTTSTKQPGIDPSLYERLKAERDRLRRENDDLRRKAQANAQSQNNAGSSDTSDVAQAYAMYGYKRSQRFTKAELNKKHILLIKRLHPDTAKTEEEIRFLTEMSQKINRYYDILLKTI